MSQPAPTPIHAKLTLETVLRAINSPTRWKILKLLAIEGPLAVGEIAKRVGASENMGSKHIRVLVDAGLVRGIHSRLYRLKEGLDVLPGATGIDFGHCLIRFDVPVQG